jgi:branched-subunit amino acid aminotransferase/4-amino-4-deoxychorismate lyase
MAIVWRDGKFLEEADFLVSPIDRGLCHGLSLFETILAVDGQPRLLAEHLRRLKSGLVRLNVHRVEIDVPGLHHAMVELLERNYLDRGMARIRFAISMGEGPMNLTDSGRAWAWMTVSKVDPSEVDLRLTLAPWRKDNESMLRGLKVGSYAENLIALDIARHEGCDEMLFFNTSDELCEAAMANVFLIRGKELFTPSLDSGCLPGVTRELVLKLATAQKISCRVKSLSKKDLNKADGIFLTSSIKGPLWVSTYQGKAYPVHPLFNTIRTLWLENMRNEALS